MYVVCGGGHAVRQGHSARFHQGQRVSITSRTRSCESHLKFRLEEKEKILGSAFSGRKGFLGGGMSPGHTAATSRYPNSTYVSQYKQNEIIDCELICKLGYCN